MISRIAKIKHTLFALAPLIWVIIFTGNLGLVSIWLPALMGTNHLTSFIPSTVIMGSVFTFFVGVSQIFFMATQNMLIKELG